MKAALSLFSFILIAFSYSYGDQDKAKPISDEELENSAVVNASCGQCKFDMEGTGCDLAVEINGKFYFVIGTNIDDHGDAHASDGFCEAIRKAKVSGEIKEGKFEAESFVLLKDSAQKD